MYSRSDVERLLHLHALLAVLLRGHILQPVCAAHALMLWMLDNHAGYLLSISEGVRRHDTPQTASAEDEGYTVTVLAFPRVAAPADVWKVRIYCDTAHGVLTFHEEHDDGTQAASPGV
jgi:hypothetical protein